MSTTDILTEVQKSKKYSSLYAPLVARIIDEEYGKHSRDKERVKAVKNRLHQMFGAYGSEDCYKKAAGLLDSIDTDAIDNHQLSLSLMCLHASTNERTATVESFYDYIFSIIGDTITVLDIGCGFNPFCLPFMPKVERYYALDIDARTSEIINRYFKIINMPTLAGMCDIISETPSVHADVAFLFKLLPLLDAQKAGRADELLKNLNADTLVVTFPTLSLGGRGKGMERNYSEAFEHRISGLFTVKERRLIGNELVYIIIR